MATEKIPFHVGLSRIMSTKQQQFSEAKHVKLACLSYVVTMPDETFIFET